MMRTIATTALLLTACISTAAAQTITGRVVDATVDPLSFLEIGKPTQQPYP